MQNDFPDGIVTQTAHRPWPLPSSPWLMTQSWHNLLFAHWPVDAETLRTKIPPGLPLDLFDGQAWIGIVPFGGKPGVYFFSLDAASAMAVAAARSILHLPYFSATMSVGGDGARVDYP